MDALAWFVRISYPHVRSCSPVCGGRPWRAEIPRRMAVKPLERLAARCPGPVAVALCDFGEGKVSFEQRSTHAVHPPASEIIKRCHTDAHPELLGEGGA